MIHRIGRIQIATAARWGNLGVTTLGLLHLAGIRTETGWPLPPPIGIAETAFLALILLYVRWQKRLSARLIASHVGG